MIAPETIATGIQLYPGDCLDVLAALPDCSVDSVVTDPPYHLTSIVKRFGSENAAPAKAGKTGAYARASTGFMGKVWDGGDIAFRVELWAQVLRVLKPGGHLVAFSGTRTYHRMAMAIDDAGFEIRDQLQWLYGSGFPKSHNVSIGIDKAAGAIGARGKGFNTAGESKTIISRPELRSDHPDYKPYESTHGSEWQGWGTALKPAQESICFAQKPNKLGNIYAIGSQLCTLESRLWSMLPANTAAKNFGLSQSEFDAACASAQWNADERNNTRGALSEAMGTARFVLALTSSLSTVSSWKAIWAESSRPENTSITETELSTTTDLRTLRFLLSQITPVTIMQAHRSGLWLTANASNAERVLDATLRRLSGTLEHSALAHVIAQAADNSLAAGARPACEPIVLARKPLIGTVAANVLAHGTGALNIDGCRVDGTKAGGSGQPPLQFGGDNHRPFHDNPQPRDFDRSLGRWPANVLHDGSDEVVGAFPETTSGEPAGIRKAESWQRAKEHGTPITGFGDSGSAARFFYQVKQDDPCHSIRFASDAETRFDLKSERVVSALSRAVAASTLRLELQLQSYRAPSTTVTASEFAEIETLVTAAIQNLEKRSWRGLPLEKLILTGGHASIAATPKPTGITMITISLLKSNGSAERVTFSITETNAEAGASASGRRFHYTSKADADDRLGSKHPTVKPLDLMQWLVRLVTPPGGTVLDPFAGTGTTGEAAFREGMCAVLIEREAEYQEDIRRRMSLVLGGPDERKRESIKAKTKDQPQDAGPLFGTGLI